MVKVSLSLAGKIHQAYLFEQSYKSTALSMGGSLVSEEIISGISSHLESHYPDHLLGENPITYLVGGVLTKIIRQGHIHFKSAEFRSDSKEALVKILSECISDLVITENQ